MHTSVQLQQEMFEVKIDGKLSSRDALFPDWGPRDRLGLVVNYPLGGIGASYLLQLAISAFYDSSPERRNTDGQYPDIYVFHVGQRFGDHVAFDLWPPRKEIVVGPDPEAVLDAINDKAITRLAVPEGAREPVQHRLKEPETARNRITSCFTYSATGQVANSDVTIASSDPNAEENPRQALNPDILVGLIDTMDAMVAADPSLRDQPGMSPAELDLSQQVKQQVLDNLHTVDDADRVRAREYRASLARGEVVTESYRRINIAEALELLGPA